MAAILSGGGGGGGVKKGVMKVYSDATLLLLVSYANLQYPPALAAHRLYQHSAISLLYRFYVNGKAKYV